MSDAPLFVLPCVASHFLSDSNRLRSYSSFTYGIAAAPKATVSLDPLRAILRAHKASNRTFIDSKLLGAAKPLISYAINVTNTGKVDSDDAVLGFAVPPSAGTNGIPLQSLYGFERVHLKAGETKQVWLYPDMTEFSQVDELGQRYVHPGTYTFKVGVKETVAGGGGYVEHQVTLV